MRDHDELVQTGSFIASKFSGKQPPDCHPHCARAQVPWNSIVGMRNILVHAYFQIDRESVWRVVEHDLAPLEAEIRRLLANSA